MQLEFVFSHVCVWISKRKGWSKGEKSVGEACGEMASVLSHVSAEAVGSTTMTSYLKLSHATLHYLCWSRILSATPYELQWNS